MLPFGVAIPATVPQGSEIPEVLMNNPVYCVGRTFNLGMLNLVVHIVTTGFLRVK